MIVWLIVSIVCVFAVTAAVLHQRPSRPLDPTERAAAARARVRWHRVLLDQQVTMAKHEVDQDIDRLKDEAQRKMRPTSHE